MIAGVSKPYNARPRGFPRQYLPPKRAKVELRGTVVGALECGACPGVEDPPTGAATVVENGFPVITVDGKTLVSMAPRTMESLGMEEVKEVVVACIFVHQVQNRKVHGSVSSEQN